MNYKIIIKGKEIEYGALVEKSHFSGERDRCFTKYNPFV